MGRPVTISDDDILAAAREVFLERGFGASTALVAERAGVSEGLLFKRFPSKAVLFAQAMETGDVDDLCGVIEGLSRQPDLRCALVRVIATLVAKARELLPRMMMVWANTSPGDLHDAGVEPPPLRVLNALTGWIEAEVSAGRLGPTDPRVLARAIMGSSFNFAFFETMGFEPRGDADAFARRLADLLLGGLVQPISGAET